MRSSFSFATVLVAGTVLAAAVSTNGMAQVSRPVRPSIATRPARPTQPAIAARPARPEARAFQKQRLQKQRVQKQRLQRAKIMKRRLARATPEQKAWMQSRMETQKSMRQQVLAGTLDRKAARAEMQTWRQNNAPPKRPRTTP